MSWANLEKHIAQILYLLTEAGGYLLQEDTGKLILDQSNSWTNQTKS